MATEIFYSCQMENVFAEIISIKFFLQNETQKHEVLKMIFHMKAFPILNDSKSQILCAMTLKQFMEFSFNR